MNQPAAASRTEPDAAAAFAACRRRFGGVVLLSVTINLLMLNGSVYMLQVYDRVLVSHSLQTLTALTVLMVSIYLLQGGLDTIRQRLLVRIARLFDASLRGPVHKMAMRQAVAAPDPHAAAQPVRDLEQVRAFLTGQGPATILDLPFAPLFLILVFLVHPAIGMLSLVGALVLIVLSLLSERLGRAPAEAAQTASNRRLQSFETDRRNAEAARAMALGPALRGRFIDSGKAAADAGERAADLVGGFGAAARMLRMLLQSLVLGLGAWLLIRQEISAGAIIATSILVGRALAPVDMAIANWRGFGQALQSARRLQAGLTVKTAEPLPLPAPHRSLLVQDLSVAPPGAPGPTVSGIEFALEAGEVLGVVGPSGAGKSSLVRALTGIWPARTGSVRLDGAALDQWDDERLGIHIGYVPQSVGFFGGTIAENIARMDPSPSPDAVIAAARAAGLHDLILKLPQGYDTQIGDGFGPLSDGQRQRLALARALYGDPFLVILDEANSNLDAEGEAALIAAVRQIQARGGIAILITHRTMALAACTKILVIEGGRQTAFGPRDVILRPVVHSNPNPQTAPATAALAS